MGSGASKTKQALAEEAQGDDLDDTYPNGPLDDAPARLLVSLGGEEAQVFTRSPAAWNRKAMYAAADDTKLFYRACVGWVFDARPPAESEGCGDDWAAGSKGWIGLIDGGPAYPPLGPSKVHDGGAVARATIANPEGAPPPRRVVVHCHPSERACGAYDVVDGEARHGFPVYRNAHGWTLAFDGGGWCFHSGVSADARDGGWVGPFAWSHPPLGETVRLNGLDDAFVFGTATVVLRRGDDPPGLPPPSPRTPAVAAKAAPPPNAATEAPPKEKRPAPPPAAARPSPPPNATSDTPRSKATKSLDGFSDQIDAIDLSLAAKVVDELLTQIVCRIDGVDTCGDASLREYRKGLIRRIDAITASLTSAIPYDQPAKPASTPKPDAAAPPPKPSPPTSNPNKRPAPAPAAPSPAKPTSPPTKPPSPAKPPPATKPRAPKPPPGASPAFDLEY